MGDQDHANKTKQNKTKLNEKAVLLNSLCQLIFIVPYVLFQFSFPNHIWDTDRPHAWSKIARDAAGPSSLAGLLKVLG